jgi:periplasmic divalent cation tolerance protein
MVLLALPLVGSHATSSDSRFYMTDKRIVLTTVGSEEEARKIAHALVERRLAACVNIIPNVVSVYRWRRAIEESGEWLLLIKTTQSAFEQVRQVVADLHSYDLPECISLAIENGSAGYMQWIEKSISFGEKSLGKKSFGEKCDE